MGIHRLHGVGAVPDRLYRVAEYRSTINTATETWTPPRTGVLPIAIMSSMIFNGLVILLICAALRVLKNKGT